MSFARIVETSVTNNSSFQDYTYSDDHTIRTLTVPSALFNILGFHDRTHILVFCIHRVTFAGKLCLILASKPFLFGSWEQTKPADRHQSSVSLGDVLSVAPSARTPDSHTRREHHFLLDDVSARDY